MDNRTLKHLERLFSGEIERAMNGGLGVRLHPKTAAKLEAAGLIERVTTTLPGRFAVTVETHELTHAGRMAYCATCREP